MSLHPLTAAIRSALAEAGDAEDAANMQAYMKSETLHHGVRAAPQKKIFSESYKKFPLTSFDEYIYGIEELWSGDYREEKHAAIQLAKKLKKYQTLEALPTYRMMIETGAWWDYVDDIAAWLIGNLLRQYPAEMKEILYQWIDDEHLWIRRSAILAQLKFKKDTDEKMLWEFCAKHLNDPTFWIRKAIGWALREYSKTNPEFVRKFVEEYDDRMSGVTRREAVKYI